MTVITRFAPSPTGFLHVGGARTALFSWLFAKHHGGKFLLRIEDTDRERSTQEAIDAILTGLRWLNIDWDDEPLFQSKRIERHREVATKLIKNGGAYYCYSTPKEVEAMRQRAKARGEPMIYDGTWRDRSPEEAPSGIKPVVRFKAPREGETRFHDSVMGDITLNNQQLDDFIILRNDLTPTYNFSSVVDDHDTGVTHVIRGEDHLTNTGRQKQLYETLAWEVPEFAHIPLIFGPDGLKLSKRHGALGVSAYEAMGYLAPALCNYLVRLGWSHGNKEIFTRQEMIDFFNLKSVGRSPARFDFSKLASLNAHYMRSINVKDFSRELFRFIETYEKWNLDDAFKKRCELLIPSLRTRSKTLAELVNDLEFLYKKSLPVLSNDARIILNEEARSHLLRVAYLLREESEWTIKSLESLARKYCDERSISLKDLAQPLRAALTGKSISPPIFDVMCALGKELTLNRIEMLLGLN